MLRSALSLVSFIFFLLAGVFCVAQESSDAQQRVIERYRELLVQTPKKGAVFDRVYGHYVDTGQSAILYQDAQMATQNKPTHANAWMLLGLVAERRSRTEQAAEAYRTAAQLEPENHLPMFYLGELLLNQRRIYDAITALEETNGRLIKNSGSRADRRTVLQALALAYSRFGEPQKSLDVWNQLAALFPNDPDILVQVAESMEFDGQLDEALKQYRRLITLTDDHFERVRLSLAAIDIMLRLGNDEEALRDLDSLLGFLNTDSYLGDAVRDRIDRIFDRARDQTRHIEFYQKRIEQNPNDTASLLRLVRVFQRVDRSADAEQLLRETIKVSPANIPLRLMLIDLLVDRRDIAGAIEQFQAMDRVTTDHLIRWGTLMLQHPDMTETARRTEAAKIWTRIAANSPNDPVAALLVADLFSRNRFHDEAEQLYKQAITLRPNDFSYRESLAIFYHQQRQKEKVLETLLLTKTTPAPPREGNMRNQAEIGQLLLTLGYIDEATPLLREAVRTNPQNGTVQSRYLEALLRQNTPESIQTIRELFTHAEKQIANDEQYALFLQQNVQLMRSVQRVAEGIRIVQPIVESNPSVRSLWHLAMLHQAEANFSSAITAVERALETADGRRQTAAEYHLPLLRFAAELYEQSGDTNKAIALYQMLVQNDPARSGDHWQKIITLQIQRGELAQALESSRNLLGRGTENAERLRFVADLFLSANRRTEAIGLLRQALSHEPGNADVLRVLAQTLADSEQSEEAIELFWRLYERLEYFPAKLSVIEILVTEYNKLGRDEELVERLQLLSRNYDRRREAMQSLVRVFTLRGDYDEAQNVLEDMLDLPEETATGEMSQWVLRELVSIAERQDDFATAARYQETLIQKSSEPKEQQHLFHLYDKLGDTTKTRKLFLDQVLRQGDLDARLALIDAMIRQGQYDSVSQVLDFLEIHEPEHWQIAFRRILVETLQDKPVGELVRKFRGMNVQERASGGLNVRHSRESGNPDERVTFLDSRLRGNDGELRGNDGVALFVRTLHPTFVFSAVAPAELNASLILQDQFLPPLLRGRTAPPAEFSTVQTYQDAQLLALGMLFREAINKDMSESRDNPTAMQHFRNTIEELREMFPADSTQDDVLINRLRLEVLLLDLHDPEHELLGSVLGKLFGPQIDEQTCKQTIRQIVRNWGLDGVAEWQPALFQILITECTDELVAERFKTLLPSDARLSEKLQQIFDNLCFELKTPPIPAEQRNQLIDFATQLVKQSAASHQENLRRRPLTLSQKTDRLLELWSELIENVSPEAREKYRVHFTGRYRRLLWILQLQSRNDDIQALEQSLRKTARNDPFWFTWDVVWLTQSFDENLMLFRLSNYEPFEIQFHRIKTFVADILPVSEGNGQNRSVGEILFRDLGGPYNFLHSSRLQRYDIFTQQELRSVLESPAQQVWNDLRSPTQTQQGRLARQFVGIDSPEPQRMQTLTPDQMVRLVELDRSLQQMTEFAFNILDELKLEPSDFASTLPVSAIPNVSLTRFRSELQGDRPVDRAVIDSLLQHTHTSGNFSAIDELFFRIILLRRAMDTKIQYYGMQVDDRVVPIREMPTWEGYTETLRQFIENKRASTVPSDRIWGTHLSAAFGDLLRMEEPTANRTAQSPERELLQIAQKLETTDDRPQTAAEQLALALIYVRQQRFEKAITMLDSMELTTSADLSAREWIIADIARQRSSADSLLRQRGSEAAERLANFRLSERDSLNLVSILRFYNRDEAAQRILDHLAVTASDRRIQADLLNRVMELGEPQQENAARVARRILTNPAFLQHSPRLTPELLLMEKAVKVLQEQNQMESVTPVLENRLRAHRDKTDSRIVLARLYLLLNRRDDAKTLALELAQNPTAEPERRQMIISLLTDFGLNRELETMHRLLLEQRNR